MPEKTVPSVPRIILQFQDTVETFHLEQTAKQLLPTYSDAPSVSHACLVTKNIRLSGA